MGLKIDGISTSEHIDSSGELLIVKDHDISDLVEGRGVLNWEHSPKSEDTIGAVIYARKILKKEDCENDRQRKYWDFVKKPFVYIIGELFEDEDHPGAVAVGAMIRYYAKKSEKLLTGFSIEGATLERDDYILKESVGRRVAVTLRPCNKTAIAGLLEDPKTKSIAKSISDMSDKIDASLIEIDSIILEDEFMPADPVMDLHKAIESLNKTLEAGMGNVAPSQLTQGAALTREHISGYKKNILKAAVRDWNRKRPLQEVVKAALPDVDDDYIHHFVDLAEELALKKNVPKLIRIGAEHAHPYSSPEQKKLVEGIYHDPSQKFKVPHDSFEGSGKTMIRGRNDAGQNVILKHRHNEDKNVKVDLQHAGMTYERAHNHYQLMNDVFGLGKHVPVAAHVEHPGINGGHPISVQEHVEGAKTPLESDANMAKAWKMHDKDGHIHKMIMANHILGVGDRHDGNVLIHPKGHLMSIDHDSAFTGGTLEPDLIYGEKGNDKLHPEAAKWVKSINPRYLAGKMLDQGHDPKTIKSSIAGLKHYQRMADRPDMSFGQMFDNAAAGMTAARSTPADLREAANDKAAKKKAV